MGMCTELRENLVLSVGSPLIDIIADVDNNFLSKFDLKPNSATVSDDSHEKLFEELESCKFAIQSGGSVTNTARILQRLLKFPRISTFVGAVGNDKYGEIVKEELRKENVNCILETIADVPTGKCAVLLTDGNRSLVTDLGASKFFHKKYLLEAHIQDVILKAKYYYMSAFFLGVSYEVLKEICKHSLTGNKIFIFNIGAPFLCLKHEQAFKEILPYVNILIGNEDEARSLAKVIGITVENIKDVAREVNKSINIYKADTQQRMTIITRGAKSIILATISDVFEFDVPHIDCKFIINTNGAGDGFIGGFLAAYIQSNSIEDCVRCGISSAGVIIQDK